MDTWGDLFERAADHETTVERIRETLSAHRETPPAGNENDA